MNFRSAKEEVADETNPFSFKEFVKIKSQSTAKRKEVKDKPQQHLKGCSGVPFEEAATTSKGLSLSLLEHYLPDGVARSPSLEEDDDDWSEMYQPAVMEAAHEFSFSDSLCGVSYSPLTLSPTELPHQFTPSEWLVDEEEEEEEGEGEEEEEGEEKGYILGDTASQAGAPDDEPEPPRDHFDLVGEVLYQSQLLTNEKASSS
ncbi:endosome-associated-trafficking regulator 1-like [Rhincodon typus]|uniref:endosome-associated-trafficking regulator 1-like n=1 Tax=Rhincodon typus TaxID=259920 RepID=UPI00202FE580|nr:endosome-associated-trafficking regulator 1-like [Rhincodon typus]